MAVTPGPDGFDAARGIEDDVFAVAFVIAHFAQVEADQEQVNLTQFSQFFLEEAQLFDFGEAASTRGGDMRPPTLLFYSRRIGFEIHARYSGD